MGRSRGSGDRRRRSGNNNGDSDDQDNGASSNNDMLSLETHAEFAKAQNEIFRRLMEHPESASLMLVNPVLAMEEVGINLSPELKHHVLTALQHQPELRQRRDELEASLQEELGEKPRPDDPAWLSRILFDKLDLTPRRTEGLKPAYKGAVSQTLINHARQLQDRWDDDDPRRRKPRAMGLKISFPGNKIRRLDMDADLPDDLEDAEEAPAEVSLEDLFFYKDQNPIVKDLLELGVIQRRSFPIHTPDAYRKVKSGEQPSVFTTWIKTANFPIETEDGDDTDG